MIDRIRERERERERVRVIDRIRERYLFIPKLL